MQRRHRGSILGLGCVLTWVLVFALPAFASEAVVVTTTTGRALEGELIGEAHDHLRLRIAGIETRIQRDRIASVQQRPSVEEFYRRQRAELADEDVEGRYRLAYELYARGALDLALRETRAVLRHGGEAAGEQRIARLERAILSQRQMSGELAGEAPRLAQAAPAARPAAGAPDEEEELPRLSQEDINRIRVYEVDLNERPRIAVPRATLNNFLDEYAAHDSVPTDRRGRSQFLRAEGYQQLAIMFDARAREFYGDVVVRDEPEHLRDFRRRIHRQYVLNYCATNQCHGGEEAPGNLQLVRDTATDAVYTNFYILHSYENEDGYMIDRARPEESLLLQYGLAQNAAQTPHPQVRGWRARFNDPSARFFSEYADFIDSLWRPRPDYGIDYHPPGMPEPEDDEDQDNGG